jgi:hypothetical protein
VMASNVDNDLARSAWIVRALRKSAAERSHNNC